MIANLLAKYSVSEIIIFIVALALALKEFVTFVDWAKNRAREYYDEDYKRDASEKELRQEIEELGRHERELVDEKLAKIDESLDRFDQHIDMLIESDKEAIKAYITEKHHRYVYERGWIDDYSMECLERRYSIYQREHGNSFVKGLMMELRSLPKQPPAEDAGKYVETRRYIDGENGNG